MCLGESNVSIHPSVHPRAAGYLTDKAVHKLARRKKKKNVGLRFACAHCACACWIDPSCFKLLPGPPAIFYVTPPIIIQGISFSFSSYLISSFYIVELITC
ncbi:hypothetical protein CANARDRAFT_177357 [[Candida] arabinofermentans NRRL YB-2248]|uniref:Uncharacterized protein n=1 Tax=[Candida] arabinofermentans NRRL YB-2248 TaxID=983967 RepID=A0A1E4SWV1_9ASCO|nr:hypothetical protein CANARDRAFT_177357 [[Candida] arabinofermentans NRRL YB-2248]